MTTTSDAPPEVGLPFEPDSMVQRVHEEGVLLLGGGRALLMQIAHPAVARGVAEHSNFRADRLGRLLRTLRPMLAIAFGTREQALAAAASVNRIHEGVAGAGYRARDPELLLWVLATLIDTSLVMHERFVRPLSDGEAEAYYADMRRIGALLGTPPGAMPANIAAFRAYFEAALSSLRVSDEAHEIAAALFRAGPLLAPVMAPTRQLTAGLLPPALRRQYGLSWGPKRDTALRGMEAASRRLLPWLPRSLRRPPWFVMP
jgi:uncharacterized protein (DUF2236 family)